MALRLASLLLLLLLLLAMIVVRVAIVESLCTVIRITTSLEAPASTSTVLVLDVVHMMNMKVLMQTRKRTRRR